MLDVGINEVPLYCVLYSEVLATTVVKYSPLPQLRGLE